jgi:ATP adenylyltransferase
VHLDLNAYLRDVAKRCFVCRLVDGDLSLPLHHVIWRSQDAIAFLNRLPTVFGSVLVAPVVHREQVTGDFTLHEYLALQRIVHAVAEAVREALSPERVYILSLGSQQANAHVHWHIVPCPPETPLEEQQLALLSAEDRGIVELEHEPAEALATNLRSHLPAWMQARHA